jgi:hypothetical protein
MNRPLRKEKSHKRSESTVRYLKKTQPEEFDLVILGGARAQLSVE